MTENTLVPTPTTNISARLPHILASLCVGMTILLSAYIFSAPYPVGDLWYMIAEGRLVAAGGIQHLNTMAITPTDITETPNTIVQQWLWCLFIYGVYSILGYQSFGWYIFCILLGALVSLALYKTFRTFMGNRTLTVARMMLYIAPTCCLFPYLCTGRPHAITIIIWCLLAITAHRYRLTKDTRILLAWPALIIFHVNVHASLMPIDFAFLAWALVVYLHDRLRRKSTTRQFIYPLIAFLICLPAALINPYGLDGTLYTFISYSSAAYGNYITEMKPLFAKLASASVIAIPAVLCMIFSGILAYNCARRRHMPNTFIPLVLVSIATLLVARNIITLIPVAVIFAGQVAATPTKLAPELDRVWVNDQENHAVKQLVTEALVIALVIPVFMVIIICSNSVPNFNTMLNTSSDKLATVEQMKEISDDNTVICTFDDGSFFEACGFKVNIDSRPEIWNSAITHIDTDMGTTFIDAFTDIIIYHSSDAWRNYVASYDAEWVALSKEIIEREDETGQLLQWFGEATEEAGYTKVLDTETYLVYQIVEHA